MKNILIILLLLIVAGLGAYIYSLEGNKIDSTSISSFIDKAKSSISEGVEKLENSTELISTQTNNAPDSFKSLPADTILALSFPFESIKPAVEHVVNTINKIKNSSIAKKLNLEELVSQGFESQISGTSQMALSDDFATSDNYGQDPDTVSLEKSNLAPSFEDAIKVIKEISSINVNLRTKIVEERAAPMLSINAKFNSDYLNKQIKPALDQSIADINQQVPGTVKSNPADPDSYNIELKAPMSPIDVVGSIANKNNELVIKLAALGSPVKNQPAYEPAHQAVITDTALSKDAFLTYFNTQNFLYLQQYFADVLPADSSQSDSLSSGMEAMKALMNNYKSFAISSEFKDGFKSKSCMLVSKDSKMLDASKAAISERSAASDNFIKLLAPRTSFAASLKASSFISYLETLASQQNSVDSKNTESAANPANDKILQTADQLKSLELREVGIIVNSPTVSFVPDYALYIEHNGKHSFKELAEKLNHISNELAPPSLESDFKLQVTNNASGQEQIVVNLMDYPLTLTAIDKNTILGVGQPAFLQELSGLLSNSDAYISQQKLKSKNVSVNLEQNDYQIFISPASLTAFARQFIPFLTMSMPDLKITDAEVSEVLALFDFNLLLTSTSSMPNNNTVCSEGHAVLF